MTADTNAVDLTWVSYATAATRLGVSKPTIRNWVEAGCPARQVADPMSPSGKAGQVVVEQVRQWAARHRPSALAGEAGTQGGRRRGAGRPRKDAAAGTGLLPMSEEEVQAKRRLEAAGMLRNPALLAQALGGNGGGSGGGGGEGAGGEGGGNGGMSLAEATRRRAVIIAAAAQLDLDERRGKLMERAAVLAAWTRHAAAVRLRLEGLVEAVAAEVVGACRLPSGEVSTVRRVVREQVATVCRMISEDPLGERLVGEAMDGFTPGGKSASGVSEGGAAA